MRLPLLGQTGGEKEDDVSYQLTQNWYPHRTSESKSKLVHYPTPALKVRTTVGIGPIRGHIEYGGELYVVSGNGLYKSTEANVNTLLGTLASETGKVTLAHNGSNNGKQILVADGTFGYIYDFTYSTFAQLKSYGTGTSTNGTANKLDVTGETFSTKGVTAGMVVHNTTAATQAIVTAVDSETVLSLTADIFSTASDDYAVGADNFPTTATHVAFIDSFFVANDPSNSGRFYKSSGYQGHDWPDLDFATAERSPDELSALVVSNLNLWLIGTHTSELWFNSGNSDFPFEPMQGGFSQWGTVAPHSVVEMAGTIFYLSQNDEGAGLVLMSSGPKQQIISTEGIAAELNKLTALSDAYAWTYQYSSHIFYVLSFPTDGRTFVYDMSTKMWHEWNTASTGYHRSVWHTYVYGKHIVGDPVNGRLYELDWDKWTDNGEMITRLRRSRAVVLPGDTHVRHHAVHVDIKEGVGNSDVADPQIGLRWRDDNGVWSNRYFRSMGKIGETGQAVVFRRLGRSHERVYEIRVTDPCNAVLIDAYANLEEDARAIG